MTTKEAIDAFGGVRELAAALGVTTQAVYKWGGIVPELRRYQIEEALAQKASK